MTNWCKIGIYLVLNQKKSKKYLVQNQNNFVPASKDLVSFWCRNKINLVQNQIQLPKSFGAEKNCFGAGKKPSWCEKKIILVQKREKPAGPFWCKKETFWCWNRSQPWGTKMFPTTLIACSYKAFRYSKIETLLWSKI